MKKKVYVAGPMRGCVGLNFDSFRIATKMLREKGFEVVSPVELDEAEGYDNSIALDPEKMEKLNTHWVRRDVLALCECNCIYLLPEWNLSTGANAERAVAKWLNLELISEEDEKLIEKLTPVRE